MDEVVAFYENRTHIFAVKRQRPKPLDEKGFAELKKFEPSNAYIKNKWLTYLAITQNLIERNRIRTYVRNF